MNKFAKLFETDVGQILVLLSEDTEDFQKVKFLFKPNIFGIHEFNSRVFKNQQNVHEIPFKDFESITEEIAYNMVEKVARELSFNSNSPEFEGIKPNLPG